MHIPDFLYEQMDIIASVACVGGAFICVYLMVIILKEKSPLVDWQRFTLMFLAITLLANGTYYYPDWAMINGHRPTGVLVNVALFANLLVMAIRGRLITQDLPQSN